MKKVLSLAVLMMVMLVSVSGLAQTPSATDTTTVPVYLTVPPFVKLTVDTDEYDGEFNLEFNPATPDVDPFDIVQLLAQANVSWQVTANVSVVSSTYQNLANAIKITFSSYETSGFGESYSGGATTGKTFYAKATLDVSNGLPVSTVYTDKHIANVIFTIAQQ